MVFPADIKADNIMMELVDDQVLHAFTRAELDSPAPAAGQTV
jgi:hypothetical protein